MLAGLHFFLESVRKNPFFCLSQLLGAAHIPLHIPLHCRIYLQCRRPWFDFWVENQRKNHWRRDRLPPPVFLGFPGGSEGKESSCNVGDLGLIPGLGRFPGEGKGYPSSILAWRIPCTVQSMGLQRVGHDWATFTSHSLACGPFFYLQSCNTTSFWPFFHPHISLSSQPGKVLHFQGLCD